MDALNLTLKDALLQIEDIPSKGWVYLPRDKAWTLDSKCAILESEEVPPELEDDPNAGIPAFAKQNQFIETVPAATLKDIIWNARAQKSDVSLEDLFRAFQYYYKHDAFISLS